MFCLLVLTEPSRPAAHWLVLSASKPPVLLPVKDLQVDNRTAEVPLKLSSSAPAIAFFSYAFPYSPGERSSCSTGNHERTRGRCRGELWLPGAHGVRGAPEEEAGETEEAPKSKSEFVSRRCSQKALCGQADILSLRGRMKSRLYLHIVRPRCGSFIE